VKPSRVGCMPNTPRITPGQGGRKTIGPCGTPRSSSAHTRRSKLNGGSGTEVLRWNLSPARIAAGAGTAQRNDQPRQPEEEGVVQRLGGSVTHRTFGPPETDWTSRSGRSVQSWGSTCGCGGIAEWGTAPRQRTKYLIERCGLWKKGIQGLDKFIKGLDVGTCAVPKEALRAQDVNGLAALSTGIGCRLREPPRPGARLRSAGLMS
jgi:hypothetical protein